GLFVFGNQSRHSGITNLVHFRSGTLGIEQLIQNRFVLGREFHLLILGNFHLLFPSCFGLVFCNTFSSVGNVLQELVRLGETLLGLTHRSSVQIQLILVERGAHLACHLRIPGFIRIALGLFQTAGTIQDLAVQPAHALQNHLIEDPALEFAVRNVFRFHTEQPPIVRIDRLRWYWYSLLSRPDRSRYL